MNVNMAQLNKFKMTLGGKYMYNGCGRHVICINGFTKGWLIKCVALLPVFKCNKPCKW